MCAIYLGIWLWLPFYGLEVILTKIFAPYQMSSISSNTVTKRIKRFIQQTFWFKIADVWKINLSNAVCYKVDIVNYVHVYDVTVSENFKWSPIHITYKKKHLNKFWWKISRHCGCTHITILKQRKVFLTIPLQF